MLSFDATSGYLPLGAHALEWDQFCALCFFNLWRRRLGAGLYRALNNLRCAGCRTAIVDGSFVTAKPDPGDYDLAFDPTGVNAALIDPVLRRHGDGRRAMKAKYLGDIVPWGWTACAVTGLIYRDFFQRDRSGDPKGVILLNLERLP
ncbi:MAG TPA: hypothetical protein VGW34_07080 [Allosphingosinicella sp.]|nr:hypothetical protein [Allosphingosinicella sp.]